MEEINVLKAMQQGMALSSAYHILKMQGADHTLCCIFLFLIFSVITKSHDESIIFCLILYPTASLYSHTMLIPHHIYNISQLVKQVYGRWRGRNCKNATS